MMGQVCDGCGKRYPTMAATPAMPAMPAILQDNLELCQQCSDAWALAEEKDIAHIEDLYSGRREKDIKKDEVPCASSDVLTALTSTYCGQVSTEPVPKEGVSDQIQHGPTGVLLSGVAPAQGPASPSVTSAPVFAVPHHAEVKVGRARSRMSTDSVLEVKVSDKSYDGPKGMILAGMAVMQGNHKHSS